MILFFSEIKFKLQQKRTIKNWLIEVAIQEKKKIGDLNIIFYNNKQLLEINKQYLNHETLTDIITFDYSESELLIGDIFISVERVKENAQKFNVSFEEELRRVMAHGILHLCGYKDKNNNEKKLMKQKEEEALLLYQTSYNDLKN